MDDISNKINQILNDPEQLQQIMDIAKSMGISPPQDGVQTPPSFEKIPEMISGISQFIQQSQQINEKQEALFQALRPYLKPGRQAKLDRAIQLARLSHLAEAAIRSEKLSFREVSEFV